MRLTVLGSAASYPGPGQACAGHLIEASAGGAILLDCGNGVISNLGKVLPPTELAAVFITHEHPDHFADIYAFQALLRFAPDGPLPPRPLYAPEGVFARMQAALSDKGAEDLAEAFEVHRLEASMPIEVGGFTVMPRYVDHSGESFGLEILADGTRMFYTADTAVSDRVRQAAAGADLLLAEATLPEAFAGAAAHLTAREAGEIGRAANAGQLVLTHIWPTNDREAAREEAAVAFGASVAVARELDSFEIGPSQPRGDDA